MSFATREVEKMKLLDCGVVVCTFLIVMSLLIAPVCSETVESECTNGVDDDHDGAIDCNDSDCEQDPACQPVDCTGEQNCGHEQCSGGSRLILSEVHYHPVYALDETGEFLEFFNPGTRCTSLRGWKVRESNGTETQFPNGAVVAAQGYYILEGGYEQPCDCAFEVNGIFAMNFFLNDDGDTITLMNSDDEIVVQYTYVEGACAPGASIIYCVFGNVFDCSNEPYPPSEQCSESSECPDFGTPGAPNVCH